MFSRSLKSFVYAGLLGTLLLGPVAHAGLFDDDQARQAILDLRTRTEADRTRIEGLTRNLLDLNNQVQQMQGQIATLRGENEELKNTVATLQQSVKTDYTDLDTRLKKFEPQQVTINGVQGMVQPGEKDAFDAALNQLKNGDYKGAAGAFSAFTKKYPDSPYQPDAQFWLGNALYATHDIKGSNAVLLAMVRKYPTHPKAPEALLALASNQQESGQKSAARKTLEMIIAQYGGTESASTAKERLAKLK